MFRRGEAEDKHDQAINPREVRMAEGQASEVTVIGQGARLEGTVVSAGSLRIDGQVKGKISAEGDVLLSAHSHVEAEIQAQNVTVAGRFKGNIVTPGKAELSRGGRVDGDISSKSLVVSEGAVFNGQSMMDQQAQAASGAARGSRSEVAVATVSSKDGESASADDSPEAARARNR
jgi:adhesin HecA-like repeat protein